MRPFAPGDLDNLRDMIAAGVSVKECAERMDRTAYSVVRAASRHKLGSFRDSRLSPPMPEGFVQAWQTKTLSELAMIFGVPEKWVRRWVAEQGLKREKGWNVRLVPAASKPAKIVSAIGNRQPVPNDRPQRDMSPAGQAADYLRQFGPVYRCDERGIATVGGKFWRRGGSLPLTDAELIERADFNRRREAERRAA